MYVFLHQNNDFSYIHDNIFINRMIVCLQKLNTRQLFHENSQKFAETALPLVNARDRSRTFLRRGGRGRNRDDALIKIPNGSAREAAFKN